MKCPECGEDIDDLTDSCPECGTSLADSLANDNDTESKVYNCEVCGEELEFITTYKQWYCYTCLNYVEPPTPMPKPDQKTQSPQPQHELTPAPISEEVSDFEWDDDDDDDEADPESALETDDVERESDFDDDNDNEDLNGLDDIHLPVDSSSNPPEPQTADIDDSEISDSDMDEEPEEASDEDFNWDDAVESDDDEISQDEPEDVKEEEDIDEHIEIDTREIEFDSADIEMDDRAAEVDANVDVDVDVDSELSKESITISADNVTSAISEDFEIDLPPKHEIEIDEVQTVVEPEGQSPTDEDTTDEIIMAGPIAGVEPGIDSIEILGADDVEIELDPDQPQAEETVTFPERDVSSEDSELKKKALAKLHQAWLKVNNINGLISNEPRVLQLADDLKRALDGDFDPLDMIVLADEGIEDADKLEKELKEIIHHKISDLFHFVNSKLFLAKKIGFEVDDLEEELDNVSTLIARSEYHTAREQLESLLDRIYLLPKVQPENMVEVDERSDIISELMAIREE